MIIKQPGKITASIEDGKSGTGGEALAADIQGA
jgi:hypothetical protein